MGIFLDIARKLENENVSKYITLFSNLDTKELAEIVVVGEFSNGKSTLINALIGLEILPSGIGAVTNNITVIKKGERNQLRCGAFLEENIGIIDIKPFIANVGNDNTLIEIELANFPFKDYVIVDTPGINDQNRERELITYEYAPKCDAMIFVLDIARGFTKYESNFFSDLSETAKDKIFIVLNKHDAYEHIEKSKIYEMLAYQGISEKKAFIISSKMALAAIQEKNNEMLKASGILNLRQELFQYVDSSQSNIILKNRKQNILNRILELCVLEIDSGLSSLRMNHNEIDQNIRQLEMDALSAKEEAKKIIDELHSGIEQISQKVYEVLHDLRKELSDELFYKSPYEIQEFVTSGKYAKSVSAHITKINNLLSSNITIEFFEFKTNFILLFFEKLPFLKEWLNSPVIEDIGNVILSVATISPTAKSVIELMKKYSKVALEYVSKNSGKFETLKDKIDEGISSIENSVKTEIDRCITNQKMSISYKAEQLDSKILGAKKAQDAKTNQKENLEHLISEREFLKLSLLESYAIELANLDNREQS